MNMTSETGGNKGAACFTVIWALENYSELPCYLLSTPWFSGEILNNTRWLVDLVDEVDISLPMSCTISRGSDGKKGNIDVSFELAILDIYGMPIVTKCGEKSFEELSRSACLELVDKVTLFEQKEKFLPNGVLTLRCKLWVKDSPISGSDICFARTVLGLEKREFFWTNKEFSQLQPGQKRRLLVEPIQKGAPTMELTLYLKQTDENEDVVIEVNLGNQEQIYAIIAKFSIVKADGKVSYTRGKGRPVILKDNCLKFEPFIQKSVLQTIENCYLLNDTLFLLCELKTSFGEVVSRLENYGHDLTTTLLPEACSSELDKKNKTSMSEEYSSDLNKKNTISMSEEFSSDLDKQNKASMSEEFPSDFDKKDETSMSEECSSTFDKRNEASGSLSSCNSDSIKSSSNEHDGLIIHDELQAKKPKRKMRHVILDVITSTFF